MCYSVQRMDGQTPTTETNHKTVTTRYLKDVFAQEAPEATTFVNTVVRETINLKASDLLIEPGKKNVRTRVRIDGVLYKIGEISHTSFPEIASRIKVLAKLDPTEKRKTQEGQFTLNLEGRIVNLRVEVAQTIYGEMIVIRVHEKSTIVMELSDLGLSSRAFDTYNDMLERKSGLLLVCGPTGCGKTTTLYSTIAKISKGGNYNIVTIEDPVEFQLEGINQMQTQEEIGFTFAEGLRTILRLSPEVIFVGEIRDQETAKIAVESGLTGQLVLTTLHAQDSVGALFRLLDLGVESYLLNSALQGIVAQRLIRKVCSDCRASYPPSKEELDLYLNVIGQAPNQLTRGNGCLSCQNLSFQGRTGIYEVLRMDSGIRDLVRAKVNEDNLRDQLQKRGFETMLRDGLLKAGQGMTTVDEVLRNTLQSS